MVVYYSSPRKLIKQVRQNKILFIIKTSKHRLSLPLSFPLTYTPTFSCVMEIKYCWLPRSNLVMEESSHILWLKKMSRSSYSKTQNISPKHNTWKKTKHGLNISVTVKSLSGQCLNAQNVAKWNIRIKELI